ncbi:MAG TPA: serine O-acetyltransferase [Phycisphaerales bacterium]|nr:serine O-acetyltransferase [Phycisphaerales bacterium]
MSADANIRNQPISASVSSTAETSHSPSRPGLWALVREDLRTNGGWSRPGAKAMVMYRFGVWRMNIKLRLLRMPLSIIYKWMHKRVRNHYGIELHYTAKLGRRVLLGHQHGIVIHEFATIGDDCIIRQGVTIGSASAYSDDNAPTLGNKVDVGAGAKILGKITIGNGARIGPNAVVMMDMPADSTAFAPPARVVQLSKNQPADPA